MNNENENENDVFDEEDRGALLERKKPKANIVNGIAILAVLLLGIVAMYVILTPKKTVVEKPSEVRITESVPIFSIPAPIRKEEPPPPIEEKPEPEPEQKPKPFTSITLAPIPKQIVENIAIDSKRQRLLNPQLGSEPVASNGNNNINGSNPNLRQSNEQGTGESNIDFSVSQTPIVQASRLPNLNWLVPKGVPIPCALNVAIQSDQSGLITCTTTEDIYSSDGTNILLDRGSNVTGEYRSASISAGKSRIFAIWDRIRTPDGVVVNINSPAAGPLGRAGIGGYIDRHYFERFGSAILISLIDDSIEAALRTDSQLNNTQDTVGDVATEILNQFTSIRPTLHKHQGGELNILVARDLDLSPVYGLRYAQ